VETSDLNSFVNRPLEFASSMQNWTLSVENRYLSIRERTLGKAQIYRVIDKKPELISHAGFQLNGPVAYNSVVLVVAVGTLIAFCWH